MTRSFGVIVEDQTDGDVIRVVIRKAGGEHHKVKIRPQKGCSKIKAKASRIIKDLISQAKVTDIIVVHDLDRTETNMLRDEVALRKTLLESCETIDSSIKQLICIPIEELEAWFWSDPEIVKDVGRGKGEASQNPHLICKPKEALQRLSRGANSKPRYSTHDNVDLVEKLNFDLCASRCPSFRSLIDFVRDTQ